MTKFSIVGRMICVLMLVLSGTSVLYAVDLDMSGVIACPVPFNPKKVPLQIGDIKNTISGDTMDVQIFDINGDTVFKRTVSSDTFNWSGYNSRGKMVKPGMYIIRVRIETNAGSHGERIIRILVNY